MRGESQPKGEKKNIFPETPFSGWFLKLADSAEAKAKIYFATTRQSFVFYVLLFPFRFSKKRGNESQTGAILSSRKVFVSRLKLEGR